MSKFNVGDKVRYIGKDHIDYPEYYPTIGTIGKIIVALDDDPDCYIQWPKNSTSGNDEHWCSTDDIELVEDTDMTNEEIWEMLESKMRKNGLKKKMGALYCGNILTNGYWVYTLDDVHNAIALAYRSGYERAMKGRPFKIGEKKKKGGHWEPVDPNNLPKEGTRVKLKKEYCNYYGGVVESGEIGIVFHDASYVTMVLGYGINFGKHKTVFLPLDRNIIANYLDMWVEDDE